MLPWILEEALWTVGQPWFSNTAHPLTTRPAAHVSYLQKSYFSLYIDTSSDVGL